jgi:small conductance mechanosensitive channel
MPLRVFFNSLLAQIGSHQPPVSGATASEQVPSFARFFWTLAVIAIELVAVAIVCFGLYALLAVLLRVARIPVVGPEWRRIAKLRARTILLSSLLAMAVAVVGFNAYLILRGVDVPTHTVNLLRSITASTWIALSTALVKLGAAILGLLVVRRLVRRLLASARRRLNRWDQLEENNKSLTGLFGAVERTVVHVGWLLLAVYASVLFALPSGVTQTLWLAGRIYVVVAIGLMAIGLTTVIVDRLDFISQRYAKGRNRLGQYEHLRALLPTLRTCLEYALWIAVASLVLVQVPSLQSLAAWGPRAIQGIAAFFAGRVVIELGRLEIAHRMLPREGLDESDRRRRATMIPLVRSAFTYAVYFGTALLILSILGFNPMPFLAGAGLLGLVIGFGAQSLINDVVSGFFILFENIYLVGDTVEVGAARGVVEAIEFRTTKIRDGEGRVHIIRNGDMKPVINYSKDYGVAIVAIDVPYDADLQRVLTRLQQASERLRAEADDVLADTRIEGITAFGAATMTIRTATRVRPGQQEVVASTLRVLINDTFQHDAGVAGRKALIGESYAKRTAARHA